MQKIIDSLLKKVRWLIGIIGLVLFWILWHFASNSDPSSAPGSLLINLAASALMIAFTAMLIDWLYERRQRLLVARPIEFARHDISSVIFMVGLILGKPYLRDNFDNVLTEWLRVREDTIDHLASLRRSLIDALGKLEIESFPATSGELASALSRQLGEQVGSIDEALRLYGPMLDAELRDSIYLLRDRMVSLRNSLDAFSVGGGVQDEPAMQQLVALGVRDLVDAAKVTDVEWARVHTSGKARKVFARLVKG